MSDETDISTTQPTIRIPHILISSPVPVFSASTLREPEAGPSATQSRPSVSTHYSSTSPIDKRLEEVESDEDTHVPWYATNTTTREFFLSPPALRTRQMTHLTGVLPHFGIQEDRHTAGPIRTTGHRTTWGPLSSLRPPSPQLTWCSLIPPLLHPTFVLKM